MSEEVNVEGLDLGEAEPEVKANLVNQLKGTEPVTDLLVNMFLRQLGHKAEYDNIYRAKGLSPAPPEMWGNLNHPQLQAEIRATAGFVIEELMEAIGLLKNKPWKQTARQTDPDTFYKELADAWHFFLELMIITGMMPDVIARYYFTVSESNDERRASGY